MYVSFLVFSLAHSNKLGGVFLLPALHFDGPHMYSDHAQTNHRVDKEIVLLYVKQNRQRAEHVRNYDLV